MTIQASTVRISFACNGSSTVFPVNIQAYLNSDFLVIATNVTTGTLVGIIAGASIALNLNSDYTLASSGSLTPTFWTMTTTLTYPTGIDLQVILNPTITQLSQYTQGQAFPSLVVQTNLDRLTQMVLRRSDIESRSIDVPDGDVNPIMTLPAAAIRANTALFFDANGNVITGIIPTTALTQSIFNTFLATGAPTTPAIVALNQGLNDADNIVTVTTALEAGTATNIAFFGDSTMWGANVASLGTQVGTPPYAQCVGAINNFFGNTAATAVNFAISGTTLAEMLAGTDGSGLTYAQRLASTTAPLVYMNHGVNDAAGGGGLQTTPAVYHANLLLCIQQTRAAGKTPIFVTPHPCLTLGTFGSQFRAETTGRFAQIMRDVCTQHGITLVDNFKWLTFLMGNLQTVSQANVNLPLSVLPDGVHGPQATYTFTGNNLCDAILGGQVESFRVPDQRIPATRGNTLATNQAFGASTSSYNSGAVVTGTTGAQSMRVLFRTEVPGLDIAIMNDIYNLGAGGITVNLDGAQAGALGANWAQASVGFTAAASFVQDLETTIVRNVPAGFHQLTLSTAGPNAIVLNGLRSRITQRIIMLGTATEDMAQRQLLAPKLQLAAGATNNVIVMTDTAISRFTENLEFEWTGQLTKNSGMCVCGTIGTTTGAPSTERLLTFGLGGAGFATLSEATAPATYTVTAYDAVDHSAASHLYRVIVTAVNTGTAQMFVDDVSVGTIALTQHYYGGWLGFWKNLNTDNIILTQICRVWHY